MFSSNGINVKNDAISCSVASLPFHVHVWHIQQHMCRQHTFTTIHYVKWTTANGQVAPNIWQIALTPMETSRLQLK